MHAFLFTALALDGPSLGAVMRQPNDQRLSEADEEAANEKETMFLWACVLGVLALAATLAIGSLLEQRHVRRLPEAGVGVIVGALSAWLASNLNQDLLADERYKLYECFDKEGLTEMLRRFRSSAFEMLAAS